MTSRQQAGTLLVAVGLIRAHLGAAFDVLGQNRVLDLDPADQAVVDEVRQKLPDQPIGDLVAVNTYLVSHVVAALTLALHTKDPDDLTTWLDKRVAALTQGGGDLVEIEAAELTRAYVPELKPGVDPDASAASKILARTDGTELAIYLAEFSARMYASAFGPGGLEQAQAALLSFVKPPSSGNHAPRS